MKVIFIISSIFISYCLFGQQGNLDELNKLYKENKYKETIDLSSELIVQFEDSINIYKKIISLRVDCYMALQNFNKAIDDWNILMTFDTLNLRAYYGLSFAYWQLGNLSESIIYTEKALKINPTDTLTLSNLSYYYSEVGRFQEGLSLANRGLEFDGLNNTQKALLVNNRGFAYLGLKLYDKALIDINQSIKLNPENSFAFYYRALANIGLKRMESVCNDLDMAKKLGGINMTKDLIKQYCEK